MATPLPAYATTLDINFNNEPVDVLIVETGAWALEWDKLHETDKAAIVNDVVPNNGGTMPFAGGLSAVESYVLPNGMTFGSVYGFVLKDISLTRPVRPTYINDSTDVYYDGADWRRVSDNAVLV